MIEPTTDDLRGWADVLFNKDANTRAVQLRWVADRIDDDALKINGLKAVRIKTQMKTPEGRMGALFTWIAHKSLVYQIAGISPIENFDDYRKNFSETAQSFRAMAESDLPNIKEARLRIVQAREGETLTALIERVKSNWTPEMTAVANGIQPDDRLKEGQLVKVSLLQSYELDRIFPCRSINYKK